MWMGQCKKDVTPVRYQWSDISIALTIFNLHAYHYGVMEDILK